MKKLNLVPGILILGAIIVTCNYAHAQKSSNIMEVGTITVNVGLGAGRSGYGNYGIYSSNYYGYGSGIGLKAALERGMWQLGPGVLTLGVQTGGTFSNSRGNKSSIIVAAARSAYHFSWNVDKLDTYAGLSAGPGFRTFDYYTGSGSVYDTEHKVVGVVGIFAGASYYFSPKIGVNVEVGYDITVIQGGLVFKLN